MAHVYLSVDTTVEITVVKIPDKLPKVRTLPRMDGLRVK
jgi:hypothetical protein